MVLHDRHLAKQLQPTTTPVDWRVVFAVGICSGARPGDCRKQRRLAQAPLQLLQEFERFVVAAALQIMRQLRIDRAG
jgi:hypothetical protein